MKQYELRIQDEEDGTAKVLISFSAFFDRIRSVFPDLLDGTWEILQGAHGYGEGVCRIEDCLENSESVHVVSEDFFPPLLSGKEYFENVRMRKLNSFFEIGVSDSTFFFVRGNKDNLLRLAACFQRTELVEIDCRISR